MSYFTEDLLNFFNELAENNHKEWFDENRKRYEKNVKEPFKRFVSDLITELQKDDKQITMQAKDAIFRINRDIRFSKDKTPYKTNVSALISEGTKKNHMVPGVYVEISPRDFRIYGGVYELKGDDLRKVREEIAYNLDEFNTLVNDKNFVKHYEEVSGEKNKRVPKEFNDIVDQQPLIANKQFYYFKKLPADTILKDNLLDIVMEYYYAGKPLKEFLRRNLD